MDKFPKFANLISLNNPQDLDSIFEGNSEPYFEYQSKIEKDICMEAKIPDISDKFIKYSWYGYNDKIPWVCNHNIPFDPQQINMILPETNSLFQIRGQNRKVVLTLPLQYLEEMPFYSITCSSEEQIDLIRVLNPLLLERPFLGIETMFLDEGFFSLPKLSDCRAVGIVRVSSTEIVIPNNSSNYF